MCVNSVKFSNVSITFHPFRHHIERTITIPEYNLYYPNYIYNYAGTKKGKKLIFPCNVYSPPLTYL